MIVALSTIRRTDGMLDYSKDGPGAFTSVLRPIKLVAQLSANNAYQDEIECFEAELNLFGSAVISFRDRRHNVRV